MPSYKTYIINDFVVTSTNKAEAQARAEQLKKYAIMCSRAHSGQASILNISPLLMTLSSRPGLIGSTPTLFSTTVIIDLRTGEIIENRTAGGFGLHSQELEESWESLKEKQFANRFLRFSENLMIHRMADPQTNLEIGFLHKIFYGVIRDLSIAAREKLNKENADKVIENLRTSQNLETFFYHATIAIAKRNKLAIPETAEEMRKILSFKQESEVLQNLQSLFDLENKINS